MVGYWAFGNLVRALIRDHPQVKEPPPPPQGAALCRSGYTSFYCLVLADPSTIPLARMFKNPHSGPLRHHSTLHFHKPSESSTRLLLYGASNPVSSRSRLATQAFLAQETEYSIPLKRMGWSTHSSSNQRNRRAIRPFCRGSP